MCLHHVKPIRSVCKRPTSQVGGGTDQLVFSANFFAFRLIKHRQKSPRLISRIARKLAEIIFGDFLLNVIHSTQKFECFFERFSRGWNGPDRRFSYLNFGLKN